MIYNFRAMSVAFVTQANPRWIATGGQKVGPETWWGIEREQLERRTSPFSSLPYPQP